MQDLLQKGYNAILTRSAANDDIIGGSNNGWFDASGYQSGSVTVVTSAGASGAITFEHTNDPSGAGRVMPVCEDVIGYSNWLNGAQFLGASTTYIYTFPIKCRYIRARVTTAFTGGTASGFTSLSTAPYSGIAVNVTQNSGSFLQVSSSYATPFALSIEGSSAKTATGTGTAQSNSGALGAIFAINVSAASGTTPTLAVKVQAQDPVSLNWFDIPGAVSQSITTTGTYALTVYPSITDSANSKVSMPLPRTYRAAWTITGTTPSFTFSIGAIYI